MKKLSLLLIITACCFALNAQEQQTEEPDWCTELPRHEVGLGIGDPTFAMLYRPSESRYVDFYSPEDSWFLENRYYHGPVYTTCPLTFHYMYRVAKFLWLGFDFSYCGVYAKRFQLVDDAQIGWVNEHYLTLMPKIRFSYFNRKYVTMYSGLSTGFNLRIAAPAEYPFGIVNVTALPAVQMTFFGVSVGKTWYGFAEVGCGYNGFVRTGFGYHFNKNVK